MDNWGYFWGILEVMYVFKIYKKEIIILFIEPS